MELKKYIQKSADRINTVGITDPLDEDFLVEICEGYYKLKILSEAKKLESKLTEYVFKL